jgi:hypothetical protein
LDEKVANMTRKSAFWTLSGKITRKSAKQVKPAPEAEQLEFGSARNSIAVETAMKAWRRKYEERKASEK